MELFYGFILGYMVCMMWPVITWKLTKIRKKLPFIQRWDSITSHTYTNDFPISFDKEVGIGDVVLGIAAAHNEQIKKEGYEKIVIPAAKYRVKTFFKIDFIKNPQNMKKSK